MFKHHVRTHCILQLNFCSHLFFWLHTLGYLFLGGKDETASPRSSSTLAGISPPFWISLSLSLYWGFTDRCACQEFQALVCTSLSFSTQLTVMVVETPGEARDAKERGPSSSESVIITSVSCLADDGKQQTWRSHVAI